MSVSTFKPVIYHPRSLPRVLTSLARVARYFCNPNFQSHIEAIPGTYAAEHEKKYGGINSGQYMVQRLTATY